MGRVGVTPPTRSGAPGGRWGRSYRSGVVAALLAVAAPLSAQVGPSFEGSVHPEAREAIDGLWSPYCPGLMLEVCTSQGGAAMRDSIQIMAENGLSGDSIIEYWVAEFGEKYRAEPRFSGAGIWAWLLPPLVGLAGLGLALSVLARRRRAAPGGPAPVDAPTDEQQARLADALARLDREEAPDF